LNSFWETVENESLTVLLLVDVKTLANLTAEFGIDAEKAKASLLSDEGIEEVKELE
jgi:hypothetical protein